MKRKSLGAFLPAIGFFCACLSSSEPCPRDQELIDRFLADEASFEELLPAPDNKELLSRLKIVRVPQGGAPAFFVAWEHYSSHPATERQE